MLQLRCPEVLKSYYESGRRHENRERLAPIARARNEAFVVLTKVAPGAVRISSNADRIQHYENKEESVEAGGPVPMHLRFTAVVRAPSNFGMGGKRPIVLHGQSVVNTEMRLPLLNLAPPPPLVACG